MSGPATLNTHRFTDQNFLIIWLNPSINSSDDSHFKTMNQLQLIVNKIISFTNVDECVDFLTDIVHEKVFMIIPKNLSLQLVPLIHDATQLYSIYIFLKSTVEDDSWTNKFKKVKRISNSIECICNSLKEDTRQCDDDLTPISIVSPKNSSKEVLNVIPPSFMYSQILKEILVDIGDHSEAKEDLVNFWYQNYVDNESQLKKINEFDKEYRPDSAIRWYSQEVFVYSILNRALRTLDVDVIMKMGFFLRDLHQQIEKLFIEQPTNQLAKTVYRGQTMQNSEFEKLRRSQGGLLSFNSFISTSLDPDVARLFLSIPSPDPNNTVILFRIDIDPTSKRTPFAVLESESNFDDEEEILFSMHSIFRIVNVSEVEENLWEVRLTLTDDNDEELTEITQCIRNEIHGGPGWYRLGLLLIRIGSLDKAEEIYETLIKQVPEHLSIIRALFISQRGLVKHLKGYFKEASESYNEMLEINRSKGIFNYAHLAATYNNIASTHMSMGKYSTALQFYERTLEIEKVYLSSNSPDLAITYNNIGFLHRSNGEYRRAIEFYRHALTIYENSLPLNHPDFVFPYNNIAVAYYHLGEYSNGLGFHEEAFRIEEISCPSNHPNLAWSQNSIGLIYKKMGNYKKARACYDKALEIFQTSRSENHPNLGTLYNNIASLHQSNKEYCEAIEFYEKALRIEEEFYGADHVELAKTYNNIGTLHASQNHSDLALVVYEKARKIFENHRPSSLFDLGNLYNNMGVEHFHLEHNAEALEFFQGALSLLRSLVPEDHSTILACKKNIKMMTGGDP